MLTPESWFGMVQGSAGPALDLEWKLLGIKTRKGGVLCSFRACFAWLYNSSQGMSEEVLLLSSFQVGVIKDHFFPFC